MHGAALVVIAAFYLVVTWDAWVAPRGLDRVGAVFLAMAMSVLGDEIQVRRWPVAVVQPRPLDP